MLILVKVTITIIFFYALSLLDLVILWKLGGVPFAGFRFTDSRIQIYTAGMLGANIILLLVTLWIFKVLYELFAGKEREGKPFSISEGRRPTLARAFYQLAENVLGFFRE